jgi:hypothetical protein
MKKKTLTLACILFIYLPGFAQKKVQSKINNYQELLTFANTLNVIDAHEHLLSAEDHAKEYLSFWNFLSDYVKWDLMSAGLPKKYETYMPKNEQEVIDLFNVVEPYLPYVENGSYMISVKYALKKYFGYDKITRANFLDITKKLNKENTVENYHKILKDAHIVTMLEQSIRGNPKEKEFTTITTLGFQWEMQQKLTQLCRENKAMTLDDVFAFYQTEITKEKQNGSVGLKFFPHVFIEPYNIEIAKQQFEALKNGTEFNQRSTLARVIYEKQIEIATQLNMVVCIHLGVWANLTDKSPSILFDVVEKYPKTTFDIYHMGIPYIRETAFLGKNYPNVYLNMCWAHDVSESMVLNSLNEWIDVVPTNKIIAFGGDYVTLPQHVVGALQVAKENICWGLSIRIDRNRLDLENAKRILKDWFFDNPNRIYNLNLKN